MVLFFSAANSDKSGSTDAVRRRGKDNKDADTNESLNQTKHLTFEVEKLKSVTSDFCKDGGFQKCVQFGPDRSIIATGGGDGHLRVWKVNCYTCI